MDAVWLVEEFLDTLGRAGFEPEIDPRPRTLNSFAPWASMMAGTNSALGGSRFAPRS